MNSPGFWTTVSLATALIAGCGSERPGPVRESVSDDFFSTALDPARTLDSLSEPERGQLCADSGRAEIAMITDARVVRGLCLLRVAEEAASEAGSAPGGEVCAARRDACIDEVARRELRGDRGISNCYPEAPLTCGAAVGLFAGCLNARLQYLATLWAVVPDCDEREDAADARVRAEAWNRRIEACAPFEEQCPAH